MPGRADTSCAGSCGRLLWRGTGSREHPVCRDCRASASTGTGTFTCEQCGRVFRRYRKAANKLGVPRFCSSKCSSDSQRTGRSRASARARRAIVASTWDGVTDEQIWDRDDWACLIPGCGLGPLRADLLWPESLSPTVDHIVPFSLGGTDIASNKRSAHAFCNGSRNNRMHPDDAPVITAGMAPLGLLPRLERPLKAPKMCTACQVVPVRHEAIWCAGCRDTMRGARRQQALAFRERGMSWGKIAAELGLSGPGAAHNVAYPPWDRYTTG